MLWAAPLTFRAARRPAQRQVDNGQLEDTFGPGWCDRPKPALTCNPAAHRAGHRIVAGGDKGFQTDRALPAHGNG